MSAGDTHSLPRCLCKAEPMCALLAEFYYLRVRKDVSPARNSVPTVEPRRLMSKKPSRCSTIHDDIAAAGNANVPAKLCTYKHFQKQKTAGLQLEE